MFRDLDKTFDVLEDVAGALDLADVKPVDAHTLDRHLGIAENADGRTRALAGDVVDEQIADTGLLQLVIRKLRPFVKDVRLHRHHRVGCALRLDVAHHHILHESAAAAVGLDIIDAMNFARGAFLHQNVPDSAGNFTPHAEHGVRVDDLAIADHDVFRRAVEPPGIAVAPGLDDHAVVALVEAAVFDKHVARHLDIDAVVVVAVREHVEPAYGHILAVVEMNRPEGRIADLEVFKPHVLATVDLQQVRTRVGVGLLPYLALGYGNVFGAPGVKLKPRVADAVRLRNPFLPERILELARISAQRTLAGDGDVGA